MKIPITMCHGISAGKGATPSLTEAHFDRLMGIASEMGFESIDYDTLAAWRAGTGSLPKHPIMIDFDHPVRSMRDEMFNVLERYGFRGNLFIHTGPLEAMYAAPLPPDDERTCMTWEEIGELMDAGWQIGAHTVNHPNLSHLSVEDPTGERLRQELDGCNATLQRHLGITPQDFAFTGTSWSTAAEREVMQRYRFGRLWIIGATGYQSDGKTVRYAEIVGTSESDEADGGPPAAIRYITTESHPYRLPSMDLQRLIYEPAAFRQYLENALT